MPDLPVIGVLAKMAVTSGSSSFSGVRANTRLLPRLRLLLASAVAASVFPTALAYDSIVAFGDSLTQTSKPVFVNQTHEKLHAAI